MGHSYNPRSEKVEAGRLSLRPTCLVDKIIKGSTWEEDIDNRERYGGTEGRVEEERRHRNT